MLRRETLDFSLCYMQVYQKIHAETCKLSENVISAYFDGTVKVLVEALSCIETEHLNLEHRQTAKRQAKVNNLIAASATIWGHLGELLSKNTLIGYLLLHWVTN